MKPTAKMIAAAAFLALFAATASAQVWNIAVVESEIDPASGASADITSAEVRQVTSELRRMAVKSLPSNKYNIMTVETVYAQGGAVLEECADENCVVTLGSKIGADYIVRGIISKLRDRFTLSVEVYDTDNGNLVALSPAVRAESVEDLVENAAPACKEMYEKFALTYGSKRRYLEKYVIVTRANPSKGGTVLRNPALEEYAPGATVEAAAMPAKGYAFAGWSGAASGAANPISVTVNDNMMLMANFKSTDPNSAAKGYRLTINVSPEDGGTVSRSPDAKAYSEDETVVLTAEPARGYKFNYWADEDKNGVLVAAASEVTIIMDGDRTLSARFSRKRFDLYVATRYIFPGAGIPSPWGGADMEYGLTWGSGSVMGFGFSFGGDSVGLQLGIGVNLGFAYEALNRLQFVIGGGAGIWWAVHDIEGSYIDEYDGKEYSNTREYISFLSPRVSVRFNLAKPGGKTCAVELMYRGLWGYRYDEIDDETVNSSFGWNHHQLMLGFHFAMSERWRKNK